MPPASVYVETKPIKPIVKWQYEQITKCLLLIQGHAGDATCPCATEGEMCLRKHLLELQALCEETLPICDDEKQKQRLFDLAQEARELRADEELKLCGKVGKLDVDLAEWSRDRRKGFEQISLSCSIAKKGEPFKLHSSPAPPHAHTPALKTEVCQGLAKASETHVGYLHVPPDPVTGSHQWHRDWIGLYAKAQQVCGCSLMPPAPPQPFGWVGGKKQLSKTIVPMIPQHRTYVEPFCGAAAVFWKKEPSQVEVLNDLDPDLMRFYRNIGSVQHCRISSISKDWDRLKARTGRLEACEFLAQVLCSFADMRRNRVRDDKPDSGGGYHRCFADAPNFHKYLDDYKARLKGVKLYNRDWEVVVRQYDAPDTFFYLDPPYHGTSRDYRHAEDQLDRLSTVLPSLKGKWILSYDDHPDVRKAFKGSTIIAVSSHYTVQAGSNIKEGKQLLIANFPITKPPAPPASSQVIPEGYLVRGVRQRGLILGGEGGLWATDNVEHARSFGKILELVKKPERIKYDVDPVTEANYHRRENDKIDNVADMEKKDWDNIRKYWKGKGYQAIDFGPMHRDDAHDYWIFDANVERIPYGKPPAPPGGDEWRNYKEYRVHRYSILGTDFELYDAWEPDGSDHTTIMTFAEVWLGRVGSRILPPELEGLTPYSLDRFNKVRRWQETEYNRAYEVIKQAFPNIDLSRARYSMGEIMVRASGHPPTPPQGGHVMGNKTPFKLHSVRKAPPAPPAGLRTEYLSKAMTAVEGAIASLEKAVKFSGPMKPIEGDIWNEVLKIHTGLWAILQDIYRTMGIEAPSPLPPPGKYDIVWEGTVEDLVDTVAASDARASYYDAKSGAKIRINIDGIEDATEDDEPFYIEYKDDLFDAYNRKEAVMILTNIREGKEPFDQPPAPPGGIGESKARLLKAYKEYYPKRSELSGLFDEGADTDRIGDRWPRLAWIEVWIISYGVRFNLTPAQFENALNYLFEGKGTPPAPIALSADEAAIPGFGEKFEGCVLKAKRQKGVINPHAICRNSIRQKHGLKVG